MTDTIWQRAEDLANRSYSVAVSLEETTEGELVFVARTRELPGCKAHGDTAEEAKDSLHEARIDYIHSLLEDGLPVPDPAVIIVATPSGESHSQIAPDESHASSENEGSNFNIDLRAVS